MKPIGENRFLLLETIREFAGLPASARRSAPSLGARTPRTTSTSPRASRPRLTGADGPALLARLGDEHANLRAALDTLDRAGRARAHDVVRSGASGSVRALPRGANADRAVLALELDDARRADLLYELGAILISRGRSIESEEACEQRARAVPRARATSAAARRR